MSGDSYLTAAAPAEGELREKGSRFLALLLPVTGEEEAGERVRELERRYGDATHHCWAWRLGQPPRERSSDAGEPAGTAGVPILRVLAGSALTDVLIVVIRWFGGTKLGKGGLARAYAGAAREALAGVQIVEKVPTVLIQVAAPFEGVGAVKRLVRPPEVEIVSEDYGAQARLVLRVARPRLREVEEALAESGIGFQARED